MDLLRLYLISGIVAHKAYWEITKRRIPTPPAQKAVSWALRSVKAAKAGILLGIVVQVLLPWSILPLGDDGLNMQAAGVALYTLGLVMAITGRAQLGTSWSDIEEPGKVARAALVSHGVYRYIRHPIYVGDILLLIGLEMALNSWLVIAILLMVPAILLQAIREERMLVRNLPGYNEYCQRTKRFLPFIA